MSTIYSLLYITMNGQLLTEEAGIDIKRTSNSNAVHTVGAAYAGESLGSPEVEVTVTNMIPHSDFEFIADDELLNGKQVEVGVLCAKRRMMVRGFILEDSFSHSVNNPAQYAFTIRGKLSKFEKDL